MVFRRAGIYGTALVLTALAGFFLGCPPDRPDAQIPRESAVFNDMRVRARRSPENSKLRQWQLGGIQYLGLTGTEEAAGYLADILALPEFSSKEKDAAARVLVFFSKQTLYREAVRPSLRKITDYLRAYESYGPRPSILTIRNLIDVLVDYRYTPATEAFIELTRRHERDYYGGGHAWNVLVAMPSVAGTRRLLEELEELHRDPHEYFNPTDALASAKQTGLWDYASDRSLVLLLDEHGDCFKKMNLGVRGILDHASPRVRQQLLATEDHCLYGTAYTRIMPYACDCNIQFHIGEWKKEHGQ